MTRKVGKGTTRVRSQRARKIYWERRGILEAGLTSTPSKTTISSVDSDERPASDNAEWRYPSSYPSDFFDHEEPSDDSDDSDFVPGESDDEETDEVGSSGTEESEEPVRSDDEYPSRVLEDLVGDELLRQSLDEINNERIKQYEAWARREMPPGAEERIQEWDQEMLKEWERSILEPGPRRARRTQECTPGDELAREGPRPQQRLRLVLKPRKQTLKLHPPKMVDSPGDAPVREEPRPSLKRRHSPDDSVLEEPPRQCLKLVHKPHKQILKLHPPTREDSPGELPAREEPRSERVPKRKRDLSPGDQEEEPRTPKRRKLELTPSDQLIHELESKSVTLAGIKSPE